MGSTFLFIPLSLFGSQVKRGHLDKTRRENAGKILIVLDVHLSKIPSRFFNKSDKGVLSSCRPSALTLREPSSTRIIKAAHVAGCLGKLAID